MKPTFVFVLCSAVVLVLTVAAALFFGLRSEKDDLRALANRLAQRAEAEFSETVQLASVLSQHQAIVGIANGRLDKGALDRLVIQTGLSAILVLDAHGRVLAGGYRRPIASDMMPEHINTGSLSKRFVQQHGRGSLFVVSHPIKGFSTRATLTLFQPLEDQALYWRALPEDVRLLGPNGEVLYEHERGIEWPPLVVSAFGQRHGTEFTLIRSPSVLMGYATLGCLAGLILVLIAFLRWSHQQRRIQLAQARMDALAQDAERLEKLVADRTRALRDSQSRVIQTAKFKILNDMASGLAHEFSQPLFALEARLDTLATELNDGPHSAVLDKARTQSKRMGQILNNLKAFARGDAEPARLIALSPVVSSALDLLDHRLSHAGVQVQHHVPEGSVAGLANASRLLQVIVNVVSNCLDAISDGGKIIIRYGDGPVITIQDDGPGFADMNQALEPFATTKQAQNGLGLGLAISRDIMASFEGGLELANDKAGGAIVRLFFAPQDGAST
jgi:signal transduction histidine kinase